MIVQARRGGSGYSLVVAHGGQPVDRWSLLSGRTLTIGRAGSGAADPPAVNLWPDREVSREHARLWQANGVWWIKDAGSKHGTRVNGHSLDPDQAMVVRPWWEIVIGGTTLFLAPPGWHRLTGPDVVVDLAVVRAVNASLAHAGLPVVERLVVRSRAAGPLAPSRLRLSLEGCIEPTTVDVPALQPGASTDVPLPPLAMRYDALDGQTEQVHQRLTVSLNGEPLTGAAVTFLSLPFNEWSTLPEHRRVLATFVLPNHDAVVGLCTEVVAAVGRSAPARDVLAAIFALLTEQWTLLYSDEPPSWTLNGQKIRLPHQVLVDAAARRGEGTCIDLALLVAACLENLGRAPLIAIVDLGQWWHALVGCWDPPRAGFEVLHHDANRLLDGAIWLDPTGLARGSEVGQTFAEACTAAERCLREPRLLFGLDVAAARRQDGIMPLPFSSTPSWSPAADEAIRAARDLARDARAQLCSAALLAGLLASGDPLTRQVVAECAGDPDQALATIAAALPPARPGQHESTRGYRKVLRNARADAQDARSYVTLTSHLLSALVNERSTSLAVALKKLGTDQDGLIETWRAYGGRRSDSGDVSGLSWF